MKKICKECKKEWNGRKATKYCPICRQIKTNQRLQKEGYFNKSKKEYKEKWKNTLWLIDQTASFIKSNKEVLEKHIDKEILEKDYELMESFYDGIRMELKKLF